MADSTGTPFSGLLGDPDFMMSMGLGLLSAGQKNLAGQGGLGTALTGAVQNYYGMKQAKQQLTAGNIDLQTKVLQNQKMQSLMDMAGGLMGGQQDAPQDAQGPQGAPPQQPMQAPGTGAPGGSAPPPWLTNGPTQQSISQMRVGGMDPRIIKAIGLLNNKDPVETLRGLQSAQYEQVQRQYAPVMDRLDTVIKSDSPKQYVSADPQLKSAWASIAPTLGFDPLTDFNDKNVRTALSFGRNQLAGQIGSPATAPAVQEQTLPGPNGQIVQRNPVTGALTEPVKPQDLKEIIDPKTGQPIYAPSGQATGRSIFNSQIYDASQQTPDSMDQAYQTFKSTGVMPQIARGGQLAQVNLANYVAQRAKVDGLTGAMAAAKAQQYKAQQGLVDDFTDPSGKAGGALVAINTAVAHLQGLHPLIDAMKNGNVTAINKLSNEYKQQFGVAAPTNYQALADMATGEVNKAINAAGGTGEERSGIAAPFKKANGPDILHGAVDTAATALAGKTEALRNAWDIGTNGTQGGFDKFLMPETRKVLGITTTPPAHPGAPGQHPPEIADLLNKYSKKQ